MAPISRFRSVIGKKIEEQVRRDAARFRLHANNRRGHGFASGANHCGKPVVDRNIRHESNILPNEKLASSSMNTTNKRDKGQTPIKDSNTRHMNSCTMNVNLDPSLFSCKNNRRDVDVAYLASKLDTRGPLKDNNIKHDNTSAMHASSRALSWAGNRRSVVPVEVNRQVSHASRPIKQDPPRKNTNTKRVEAIMPNDAIMPYHDPLKVKTTNNSQSPQFKAMAGLVHRPKNFEGLDGYNDALPSRLQGQVSLDNRGGFIVDNQSDKVTEEASSKRMKKQRNKEAKEDDTSDRNPLDEINGDVYPFGVKDHRERNLTYGPIKRQRGNTETNEDELIDNGDMEPMEVVDGNTQLEIRDCRSKNKQKRGKESNEVGDGKANDSFAKKKLESLPKDHVSLDCTNEATQPEKQTNRKSKRWRQDIMRNEDKELHVDGGDRSPLDAHNDSSRLTSQARTPIDCLAKVPAPFVLEHVKKQCNYCSKPIDEPIWSGIFKIDGKEYISLAGHLSTKSCDKVWKLSRSLMAVIEVAKLSRSKIKIWETSKPSCDSIGLYFFPNMMRHDENLDKLVKEVIEDDLVLHTVIGEAEMLMFSSTLLPERYKTFQRKHYLWGVFRPRQDQRVTAAETMHNTVCRAQENKKEEKHASNQQDEVQVHWKSPDKSMQQAAATGGVAWSPNMDFQPRVPEERQLGDKLHHTLLSAEATAVVTNPAVVTTEAAPLVTSAATLETEAAALATNPVAATTEAAAVATNPAAVTTEAAPVPTSPAAVTTEAAALATNPAAVTTEPAAPAANAAIGPAEATENGTNAATIPLNHGQSDSIAGVPSGSYFCFIARPTPKFEELIQEMQREGSLVLAIRGEAIGAGPWPSNIASTNITRA